MFVKDFVGCCAIREKIHFEIHESEDVTTSLTKNGKEILEGFLAEFGNYYVVSIRATDVDTLYVKINYEDRYW